jgi:hypothetical protein
MSCKTPPFIFGGKFGVRRVIFNRKNPLPLRRGFANEQSSSSYLSN